MLYKIVHDKDCFELNPELHAIAEFSKLTDKQMRFTMLVADRRSPLRSLPERQRREKACTIAGYTMEGTRLAKNAREIVDKKVVSIEKAIAKYRELQFDENQDTLDTVNAQIEEIKYYLKSDKSGNKDYGKALKTATELGSKLPELIEAKQKLESLLQITTDIKPEVQTFSSYDLPEEVLESEESLNAIEQFHKINQKKEE